MRTDSLCVDASRIELRKDNELSWLINSEYSESPVSSFLALLTTVVYRNSYNEAFSLPLYSYASQHSSNNSLENLAEDFVKQSFTFDSNINPNLPELARAIASTLASSTSEKTPSNYDDIAGIIVCLSEKPLSQEMLDAAETLHNQTNSELTCLVTNTDEAVEIAFLNSNSSRYQRIPEYLCNLATAVGKNPHQCIHTFNILSPEEIQQQLIFGRGEKVSLPDRPVYKNIEAFAVEIPQAIAASCGNEQLTYGELNHQANQLAHFLLQFTVEIGDKVVAFLERSNDIVKAIFAIHKVGAVYVPIDPAFPKERIRAILTEVNPKLILTNSDAETVLEDINIPRLNLKNSGEMLDSFPSTNPEINFQIESESHIFFTSGTTGKPKGVLATHRNLVQYLSSAVNRYKFSREDKFISAARFTFSINLFKILTPLYVGGSVRIIPRDVVLNLPQLCQELQQATVFHFGPSLLKQLLPYIEENFPDFSPFNQLRHVSSGGDMVPPEVLEKLKQIFVNAEVYVIYGSSEISCMGCTYELSRDITLERTKVGKPHQNMSVRLFDKYGNMVPIGAPGKLYFSGDGLVKGYLHQEQLTAEKFTLIDGDRFYSIGDVGRFDPEGNIELLGRDDFQVQIRGMRVELPEIEYYLKRFAAIADCVVVSKLLDKNTDPSLVAYLVLKPNAHTDDAEIREYLYNVLPDYMVPNIFVTLDKLPTNLNGKIDRSALPNPERNKDQELVKPRNPLESHLAQIWQDVLGFEVGIDRDFLSLGGHSLQATQIVSRIRDVFHVDIPVSAMLQNRQKSALANIISLAEYVTNITQSESFRKVPALQPVSHGDELPLTSYQERIWLLAQRAGKYAIHNLPMVFHLAGDLNIPCLEAAFNQAIERHQSLRTVFPLSNHGLPIQKILPEVKIKISVEEITVDHLSNEQIDEKIANLITTEVSKYFNLEKDALIRVKLLNLSRDNHILIITCHHIISDGWSLAGVLLNEISAYYNFLLGQGELGLPELKINYGDYTLWHQAQEQATEDLLLEYWTNQLQGALPLLSLPTDRHRPHSQTFKGSIQYFEISQQLREKIEQIAQENGATLFMVLRLFKLSYIGILTKKILSLGLPLAIEITRH
jgi:amino acid adenylation domain-containing protein